MTAATIIAIAAAGVAVLALLASVFILRKVRAHQQMLEREIERGKGAFDEVVARELQQRSEELERTLARYAPTRSRSSPRRSAGSRRSGAATSPSASATRARGSGSSSQRCSARSNSA